MQTDWTCWRDASHTVTTHDFGWPQCLDCHAAPAYYERPAYLDERLELTIYVPDSAGIANMMAPRSALVGGVSAGGERVLVHFEGWVNGPAQYADRNARGLWEAGVEHAASRLVTDYPTSACMTPKVVELCAVGTYNPTTHVVTITNEEALNSWLKT